MRASSSEAESERYEVARRVLSRIAHPVAIVAAAHGAERSCATATAMYASFAPPMVTIAEHTGSRTTRLIRESGEFSLSMLHDSQQDLAMAAGRSAEGPDKLATLRIATVDPPPGLTAPGIEGSIAVLWCRVRETVPTGDHIVFIGEVVAHRVSAGRWDPLLRYARRYMRIGHWTSEESPEGYPT